ncbi:MAG TPA: DNA-binding protein [Noviherbaspirillum sp.]|uniref:DNA-binding protein n=1 Tax=Noviherbaspirillum sp. TaxID=1926288 RepID=UPI002B48273C|nr:DNA-binding protein [Noviherbaspirillum sp.]HJV85213.1 DNA-binding protein [Noviherbaspirillum sp.]
MARSGLYKSEVKKARDSLVAMGKHPSVDAVRVALGNTGSKTTIHKYLKELEAEEGSDGRKPTISDALQDLVERLAAQLHKEADAQVDAVRAQQAEQNRKYAGELAAARHDCTVWHDQARQTEAALRDEQAKNSRTKEALQQETIARSTSEQQVADIKERLAENESHRKSLEEKHRRAYEALEHYRQSVKDQREQDQQRHGQQIQQLQAELRQAQQTIVVKQEDITRLNQEGARLVNDLSHARQALLDEQEHGRRLSQKLDAARSVEQRYGALEAQAANRESRIAELKQQLAAAMETTDNLRTQLQTAHLDATAAKAALAAQQTVAAELRAFLNRRTESVEQPRGNV